MGTRGKTKGEIEGKNKAPKWWSKIMKVRELSPNLPCQDHTSFGEDCVYFEPYGVSMDSLKFLTEFCEENNLHFSLGVEPSTWNSPHTFLIRIVQK